MSDPDLPLNCPHCGERLAYVRSESAADAPLAESRETHVYACRRHGEYLLSPDGLLRGGGTRSHGPNE